MPGRRCIAQRNTIDVRARIAADGDGTGVAQASRTGTATDGDATRACTGVHHCLGTKRHPPTPFAIVLAPKATAFSCCATELNPRAMAFVRVADAFAPTAIEPAAEVLELAPSERASTPRDDEPLPRAMAFAALASALFPKAVAPM